MAIKKMKIKKMTIIEDEKLVRIQIAVVLGFKEHDTEYDDKRR